HQPTTSAAATEPSRVIGTSTRARCVRVESSLDSRTDFLRHLYLGCDPETEGLCQRYEVNRVRLPVAAVTVELGSDLPAHEIVLAVANGDIARVVEHQEYNRNVVHHANGELLHTHHEVAIANDAHDRRIRLSQLG